MKTTTKILSTVLVAILLISTIVLTGCQKEEDPATLLIDAFEVYHDAVKNNAVLKVINDATSNGAIGLKVVQNTSDDSATTVDMTAYLDAAKSNVGLVLNAEAQGQKIDVKMLLTPQKLVAGTSLLKDAYGLDIEKAQENFPKSLFGTQGANMLNITAEQEQEVLKALKELADAMKQETKTVDLYQLFIDALRANATFTADSKEPINVQGAQVKGTTVTATLTKGNVKTLVNEIITKAELTEAIDQILEIVNTATTTKPYTNPGTIGIVEGASQATFKSMNDVLDKMFEDKKDEDTVLTLKAALDNKHNAIMRLDFIADDGTFAIEFGEDPANITKVVLSYTAAESKETTDENLDLAHDDEPKKLTIDIKDDATSAKYTILDDEKTGLVVDIDKAHKKVTLTAMDKGEADTEGAYSFTYELTDKLFALTFTEDGDKAASDVLATVVPTTLTLRFESGVTSPVKYDDYKDLLTMTEEDFQALMTELAPYLPSDPDDPEIPVEESDSPYDTSEDVLVNFGEESDT